MTVSRLHNNPPDPIDEAVAPYGDAIEEAGNWLDGKAVENEGQMKAVDALLKDIKSAIKDVKAAEESEAKPLYDAWKTEKARWAPTIEDLERIKKGLASCVDAFKRKLAAAKEAERKAAFEEVERKRREAERAAAEADASNLESQRAAAAAQHEVIEAQKAAAKVSKGKVTGLRTVHKPEIKDMRAALHWIARNDKDAMSAFVTEYVRRNFRDAQIDGVRAWTEKEAF